MKRLLLFIIAWVPTSFSEPFIAFEGPQASDQNLAFLNAPSKQNELIALAEATHGSSTADLTRFRLTQYLVEQQGRRIIYLEWSVFFTERLKAEIAASQCRPEQIAKAMYWFPSEYQSIEFQGFLIWYCKWNQQRPHDPLQFYGIDTSWEFGFEVFQSNLLPLKNSSLGSSVAAPLEVASKACVAYLVKSLEERSRDPDWIRYQKKERRDPTKHEQCNRALYSIQKELETRSALWISQIGIQAFTFASIAARNLQHMEDLYDLQTTAEVMARRDVYMAKNMLALRSWRGPKPSVLLAHNFHVFEKQKELKHKHWHSIPSAIEVAKKIQPRLKVFTLAQGLYSFKDLRGNAATMTDPNSIEVRIKDKFQVPFGYLPTRSSFFSALPSWVTMFTSQFVPHQQADAYLYIENSPSSRPLAKSIQRYLKKKAPLL